MLQIVTIPNSWREVRARYGIRKSCNFVGISSRLFCIAEQVYFPDNRERSYLPQGHLRSELLSPDSGGLSRAGGVIWRVAFLRLLAGKDFSQRPVNAINRGSRHLNERFVLRELH